MSRKRTRNEEDTVSFKPKDHTELELEALVFGGDNDEVIERVWEQTGREIEDANNIEEESEGSEEETVEDDNLFYVDTGGGGDSSIASQGREEDKSGSGESEPEEDEENDDEYGDSEAEDDDEPPRKKPVLDLFGRKPAWHDSDDENLRISIASDKKLRKLRENEEEDVISGLEYEQRLRHQFSKIYPVPNWAVLSRKKQQNDENSDYSDEEREHSGDEETAEDEDVRLFQQSHGLLSKRKPKTLPAGEIEVTRMKNANQMAYSQSVVTSLSFHPSGQVLMTSGLDKTLRLFQIDGKINPKIQSVYFKDMPIHKAAFTPSGTEIIATGRRKYFYIFDVEAGRVERSHGLYGREEKSLERFSLSPCGRYIAFYGRDGTVVLACQRTKQWIGNLKMNAALSGLDWRSDGEELYSVSQEAEVYRWDLKTMKCEQRWWDMGGYRPSCLALSRNDRNLAIGSKSGIVNVYDKNSLGSSHPKALKSIMNLTTRIHDLKFNHDGQILGMASRARKDQFRLVHLPSLTVFSNWPTSGTPLSYVNCFEFSPNSGYLGIGNDKGRVLLYRLRHYPSA
ncbi:uncharacterized protein VTP21DRAFT_5542 [Calcarisporiella thermophila]|uniref:uncharacterized protein n=1 Tax=Calcarisporiella thermophila TaxID=911321 RepID=UPI00374258C3